MFLNLGFFILILLKICLLFNNVDTSGSDGRDGKMSSLSKNWASSSGLKKNTPPNRPPKQHRIGKEQIDEETKNYNICVLNVYSTFGKKQDHRPRVKFAIKKLTDKLISNRHGWGYYHYLWDNKHVEAGDMQGPQEFCWLYKTSSIEMFDECNFQLIVYGKTNDDALYYAYFNYIKKEFVDTPEMLRNHKKDYMDYISENCVLSPIIPKPEDYCRIILNNYSKTEKIRQQNP